MGQYLSLYTECPVNPIDDNDSINIECFICNKKKCYKSNTNLTGRFIIINKTECKCNSCNTIFPKSQFYS